MYTAANEQRCLDDCVRNISCVGVDVTFNRNGVECWPHTDPNDYADSNIYSQSGTNSHQLIDRCPTTTTGCSLCYLNHIIHYTVHYNLR